MNSSDQHHRDNKTTSHRLNDMDALCYNVPYICTISWLHGDYKSAEKELERRFRLMVKKNPWLLGRISPDPMQLTYVNMNMNGDDNNNNSNNTPESDLSEWFDVILPSSSPISREVPFSELGGILADSGMIISSGPQNPIFKVTVIPCSKCPEERFALFVQLSHAAGDGATYYKLFHMLCSTDDDDIVELTAERISTKKQRLEALGGKDEDEMRTSALDLLRRCIISRTADATAQLDYGWVDGSKMKEMKERSAREAGIPFVSTNDVITSWFMTQISTPVGKMAMDWRCRLGGLTDLHAGNYQDVIRYQKEDFATPALIRQSLKGYRRAVTGEKRFSFWRREGSCLVTNWCTFAKPIEVEGCTEDIHLPILPPFKKHLPPTSFGLIIFQASLGKIGMLLIHSDDVSHLDSAPFLRDEKINQPSLLT